MSIRIGKVSSVNYKTGMMRVTYQDKGKATTTEMPYINYNNEYNMPEVGSQVVVAHLTNGSSRGVVLGNMWNVKNIPAEHGKGLYRKDLSKIKGASMCRYDDESGEYLVKAPNILFNSINQMEIKGPQIKIEANISVLLDTKEFEIHAQKVKVEIPELINESDILFSSEKNTLKAVVKSLMLEIMEELSVEIKEKCSISSQSDIKVNTEGNCKILSKDNMKIKTDTQVLLEDAVWNTTLGRIMERLEALDGNTSDRK